MPEKNCNQKNFRNWDGDTNFVYDFEMTLDAPYSFGNKDLHFDKMEKLSPLLGENVCVKNAKEKKLISIIS